MNIPSYPYHTPHERSPRTPLSANSEIGLRDGHEGSDLENQELRYQGSRRDSRMGHDSPPNQRVRAGHGHAYSHQHQSLMQSHQDRTLGAEGPDEVRGRDTGTISDTLPPGFDKKTAVQVDPRNLAAPARIAGRKRPSVSIYGLGGWEDATPGRSGVDIDVTDGNEVPQFSAPVYYPDPLHQDGADAARLRGLKHESLDQQTRLDYKPLQHNRSTQPRHTTVRHSYAGHD
ncbi:hypothetical protein BGX26_003862, partial [Mortierella sp. AD094]